MAIPPEAIFESISKLNKCSITGKILDIKPKVLNDCETILDVIVKSKDGYYTIKMVKTTKDIGPSCPIDSQYKGNTYSNDIGKENSFLVNRDGLNIIDIQKLPGVDLTKTPPPIITINGLGFIGENDSFIKQFSNIEACKPNLSTKDYYINYVFQGYPLYYIGGLLILILVIGVKLLFLKNQGPMKK